MSSVPARILLFYVGAMVVVMSLVPWNAITGDSSPFVQIFFTLGTGAVFNAAILGVVVLLGWFPDTRVTLIVGAVWLVLLGVGYALLLRDRGDGSSLLKDDTSVITLPRS